MNTLQKTLIALATGSLLSVSAQAAVNYTGQPYIGVKAGQIDINNDDLKDVDKATAYGVYGGYNFDPNIGVELDYVGSEDVDYKGGTVNTKTYGAYGTYRYYFPNTGGLYGKAKLGIANTKTDADWKVAGRAISQSSSDTGLAGGLGLGYSVSPNMSIEGEYDMTASDNDAKLWTIGAHVKF